MTFDRPAWFIGNVSWLFAARIARSFSQAMLVIVVPLYVSDAGYSTLEVGYLLSLALAGSTGMTLLVGIFSDRYGRTDYCLPPDAQHIGGGPHMVGNRCPRGQCRFIQSFFQKYQPARRKIMPTV
jgi:MFS family permease